MGKAKRERDAAGATLPEATEGDRLTSPGGWPRPWSEDGYPIPWISPVDNLGQILEAREEWCADGMTCGNCGRVWDEPGTVAYAFFKARKPLPPPESEMLFVAMNAHLLCDPCVKLSLAWCPGLNEMLHAGELQLYEVPTGVGVEIDVRWSRQIPLPTVKRLWPTPGRR